jgi:hypothetical protein
VIMDDRDGNRAVRVRFGFEWVGSGQFDFLKK